MNQNPYEVLGVARDASDADIKKAYHKLVMKYHPDRNPGDKSAEEKFKEVNNAFEILKDPQKRAAYDQFGSAAFAGGAGGAGAGGFGGGNPFGGGFNFNMGGGAGMDDILREAMRGFGFGDFSGGADGASRASATSRGRDLLDDVVIDLRDAYFGKTHTVKFATNVECDACHGYGTADGKPAPECTNCHGTGYVRTQQGFFAMESPCPECNGTGHKIDKKCDKCDGAGRTHKSRTLDVKIPAGVEDGTRLRLAGQGEAGAFGGPAGDFYLDIHVRPDEKFERVGSDLVVNIDVPFTTLALGGEIDVTTIDDKTLSVKVPAGTQVGERLRVRGHGMPGRRAGTFGDMYITIGVHIPTKLTEKQKKALAEFADIKPGKKGWF